MDEYTKINTIWKRDERGKIMAGDWATPELATLAPITWEWTEKVDGTNIRIGWDGTRVTLGGRTDNAQLPAKLVAVLTDIVPASAFAAAFPEDVAGNEWADEVTLYGEGYGAGIQGGGGNYSPTQTFVLFDVKVGPWWLSRENVADVATKMGLTVVPVFGHGSLLWANETVRAGVKSAWGDFPAEGLVGRTVPDLFDRKGERIMAKIKAKDFR